MALRLSDIDPNQRIRKKEAIERLEAAQLQLATIQHEMSEKKLPVILVFEGWDAGGKGGACRRIIEFWNPRSFAIHPVAAPSEEEKLHHYLWRFWRDIPARGKVGIFDRSWYGRVLVERVEKFATKDEWKRAYTEINNFEQTLHDDGYLIIKFFMHISPDEQLRRFQDRENNPLKAWKMTEEDYRNRDKWDDYEAAINDMLQETNTACAPWHVIPGNHKATARTLTAECVLEAIQNRLK